MNNKCSGCGVTLQISDENKIGYIKSFDKVLCKRCYELKHFNKSPILKMDSKEFVGILDKVVKEDNLLIYVVDLFNFDATYTKEIENKIKGCEIILVANKLDLFPKSINDNKIKEWIKSRVSIQTKDIFLISATKKYYVDALVNKIIKSKYSNVYLIGHTNTGKSSLLNTLVKSTNPKYDSKITTSYYAGTTLGKIKIKLNNKVTLIDTPGIENENDILNKLSKESMLQIIPKTEIKPKGYQLSSGQTLFISGFVQFDFLEGKKSSFIVYANSKLNVHRTKFENAEEFRLNHLGKDIILPPNEEELKLVDVWESSDIQVENENIDVFISGIGWIYIKGLDKTLKLRITLPKKIEFYKRKPLIGE